MAKKYSNKQIKKIVTSSSYDFNSIVIFGLGFVLCIFGIINHFYFSTLSGAEILKVPDYLPNIIWYMIAAPIMKWLGLVMIVAMFLFNKLYFYFSKRNPGFVNKTMAKEILYNGQLIKAKVINCSYRHSLKQGSTPLTTYMFKSDKFDKAFYSNFKNILSHNTTCEVLWNEKYPELAIPTILIK